MQNKEILEKKEPLFLAKDIVTQVLAGGKGKRILSITEGKLPKSLIEVAPGKTILDIVIENMKRFGFERFIFSLNVEKESLGINLYKNLLEKKIKLECIFETGNPGSGGAVKKMIEVTEAKYPLLVVCSDMILPWDAFAKFSEVHKKGTFTWITSSKSFPEMEKYSGLMVRPDGAVVYDKKLTPEGKFLDDGSLDSVTKSGAIMIDPDLFLLIYKKLGKPEPVDLFWDLLPVLERENQQHLFDGRPSLLNTIVGKDPIIDIGTPELLSFAREYLERNYVYRSKNPNSLKEA